MRELTKSMLSFSLTMSLFGVKQLTHLLNPAGRESPGLKMKQAFDSLSGVVQQQFGETFQETFRAGDEMQRRMVDVMYGFLESGGSDTDGSARVSSTAPQQRPQAVSQHSGWGPVA